MSALKTAEGWIGIGFATLLGIGALLVAGVLALAQRIKSLTVAAFSGIVPNFK